MLYRIRVATPADAGAVLGIYAPYCTSSHVSFEIVAPSEAQMRERIERTMLQYPWLVVEDGGDVGGYVYASQHRERAAYRWSVDVAVYIAAAHRRRGLGRALYTSLLEILREQGYFQAHAGITLPNAGSEGLHRAMGFEPVAVYSQSGYKLGRWLDVAWWRLQLQGASDEPAEPRPFSSIFDGPAVAAALAKGEGSLRAGET